MPYEKHGLSVPDNTNRFVSDDYGAYAVASLTAYNTFYQESSFSMLT